MQSGLGLVVIDYLHLLLGGEDEDVRELSRITRESKRMARELGCPVMLLSQLNRNVESQSDKRPSMAHLRGSGAIEQDSDLVILLYRDEYYNPNTHDKGIAELIVAKHRNGPTGTVKLLFDGHYTRFRNLKSRNHP
jgi:replicative DNA helicase